MKAGFRYNQNPANTFYKGLGGDLDGHLRGFRCDQHIRVEFLNPP